MSTEMQTKVQASPVQSFIPVQTGLLQRKYALCNTPGWLVEDSGRDKEKLTLQRSPADQAVTTTVPRFGHDFSKVSVHSTGHGMIQTKLKINESGDPYEQEADRVTEQVMRMEELEEEIQAKLTSGQAPQVSPILQNQIHSLRSGGQPLSPPLRNFFEPRFVHDFSRVRVHTDALAEESARALSARAFTMGRDVVFGSGQYAPETVAGKRLIAHELTHVIQQNSSNHNISPETKEPAESDSGYVLVRQKKPAGISLAGLEENGTDRSQQSESERKLGFCDQFINDIESLASGSDNKQWRSQDLNRIGRLALEYMDVSQLRALSDELEIPPESEVFQEAVTETPTEGVIQRDAAAAGVVAGTMWWLTLVDGPLPVGDLVYLGLIAIAAVAIATTASRSNMQRCRCTIRYAPPDIMAQCPPRVYGVGATMHDCQNNAKFTAPQQCRRYYGHCGWVR